MIMHAATGGVAEARVFDVDPTNPDPDGLTARPDPHPTNDRGGSGLRLATCSYTEFRPGMGVPVRFTAGAPRWRLPYPLAGHARSISPRRDMLALPPDAYTLAYGRLLDTAGVDAVRRELAQFASHDGSPVVLLCFERLNEEGKWCHRTLFAEWWEAKTEDRVPELGRTGSTPHPHLY